MFSAGPLPKVSSKTEKCSSVTRCSQPPGLFALQVWVLTFPQATSFLWRIEVNIFPFWLLLSPLLSLFLGDSVKPHLFPFLKELYLRRS